MDWTGAGSAIIGGIGDVIGTGVNNAFSQLFAEKNRERNYHWNEKAATQADLRTRALYNDLQSPKALLQQYQEAGLSPSLMFGGGGIGGQTAQGAQGEGASGVNAQTYGVDPMAAAQLKLLEAQTRKTNAEADRESGIGKMGEADFKKLVAEGNNEEAKTKLNETENQLKEIHVRFENETYEDNVGKFKADASKAATDATTAVYISLQEQADAEVKMRTIEEQVQSVTFDNDLKQAEKILKLSQVDLNNKLGKKITWDIAATIHKARLDYGHLLTEMRNAKSAEEANRIREDYNNKYMEYLNKEYELDKDKFAWQQIIEGTHAAIDLVDAIIPF